VKTKNNEKRGLDLDRNLIEENKIFWNNGFLKNQWYGLLDFGLHLQHIRVFGFWAEAYDLV